MPPGTLPSSRGTSTFSWRLPRESRVLPRPSFRATRSATVTCRTMSGGVSRRRRPAVTTAWGTREPLASATEPPLLTLHVNNRSCAASGSEAFFNLTQHGGRRGTALSRSSSSVSALSRGSNKLHSLNPATHASLGRRASLAVGGGRRVGRSYSAAAGDRSTLGVTWSRTGGRARRQRPHLHMYDQHVYYQQQLPITHHHQQQTKYPKTSSFKELRSEGLDIMPRAPTPPPVKPRPPTTPTEPCKWGSPVADAPDCTCRPCNLGGLVARAYKAVLKAASTCKYPCFPVRRQHTQVFWSPRGKARQEAVLVHLPHS